MKLFKNRMALGLLLLGSLIPLTFAGSVVAAGPPSVGLGTADAYGVLAGDTITNTGATTIDGNLGLYPGTSVTGSPTVNGESNINNSAAQTAKADLRTAYLDAEGRTGPTLIAAGALGGRTLSPGLYKDDGAPASLGIATGETLTLQGDASSVWIFQSASTLIAETGSRVVLTGGAQACNVFWQVGSSATLRSGSTFVGTVMAHTSITVENSVTVSGRLLAGAQANGAGALTMNTDTIARPRCAVASTESAPADVGVSKTASPTSAAIGDNVTYTSVVTNNGPGYATGVAFADTLPAGETFVSVTSTQGTCSGTSTVTCAIGDLAVGSTATISIVVRMTTAGAHRNTASVSAKQADQNVGANNTSSATVDVAAPAATPPPAATTPTPTAVARAAATARAAALRRAAVAKAAAAKRAAAKRAAAAGASTSVAGPALPPVNPAGFTG